MKRLTRREALWAGATSLAGAGLALGVAGCGSGSGSVPAASGSTLMSTWGDPVGDGQLRVLGGERFVGLTSLGPARRMSRSLATLAHLTDAHVMDAASPARVTFLARLGPPFQSTFRPQEALTVQVLAGAVQSVRALSPDVVIEGGDLIDNDQANELSQALSVLRGGSTKPGSGPHGYYGVQSESDPDPFYYRPAVDAPRHPDLLSQAVKPFQRPGLGSRSLWLPVLGDHDILVAGELVPTDVTSSLALGDQALWELPPHVSLPPGVNLEASATPDGPPDPGPINTFIEQALEGPTVRVPADEDRRELSAVEVITGLRRATGDIGSPSRLDYIHDVGDAVRLVILDVASRVGGSGGVIVDGQTDFVADAVASAGDRWIVFITHQPLRQTAGGSSIQTVLDASARVVATLAGHTHRNRITARPTSAAGYWEIETASLIDYPQQARALKLWETDAGGVAIQTWMLDHVESGLVGNVGRISRELSYLDAAGGRPNGFAGQRSDRNAVLYRRPV